VDAIIRRFLFEDTLSVDLMHEFCTSADILPLPIYL
jgi:hypothetical protein